MTASQDEIASRAIELGEPVKVHLRTWLVVISVEFMYFCQLTALVGSGFLASSISQRFGAPTQGVWFSSALNILTVALGPPVSQAADFWGRKWFIVVLAAAGFAGAVIVSRAQNIATVIAGFTIIGINFGSQPILLAVVSEVLPRKFRPLAQASINVVAGTGGFVGVIMGGALLRNATDRDAYRIYFYVVAAIYAFAMLACAICYNPPMRELQVTLTTSEKLRRLDWFGLTLFAPGLAIFCIALAWSQNPYQWKDAHILAPFLIGGTMIITFGFYEWRIKKDGIFHHGLFQNRNFALALLGIFTEGLSFITTNNYFAMEVVIFKQTDILDAGLRYNILFWVSIPVTLLAGAYSTRWKVVRSPLIAGFLTLLLFNILMATNKASSSTGVFWGYPAFAGVGLGLLLPTLVVTAQLSTPPELISIVSGLMVAFRGLGATIGVSVNNAILNAALAKEVPKRIAEATIPLGLPVSSIGQLIAALTGDTAALTTVPGVTPDIIMAAGVALVESYEIALRNCFIAAACFCVVAVVGSFFVFDPKEEFSDHIDAPVRVEVAEMQKSVEYGEAIHEEVKE